MRILYFIALMFAALALSLLAWKRQEEGMRDEDGRD
jgi:hypothetical protein